MALLAIHVIERFAVRNLHRVARRTLLRGEGRERAAVAAATPLSIRGNSQERQNSGAEKRRRRESLYSNAHKRSRRATLVTHALILRRITSCDALRTTEHHTYDIRFVPRIRERRSP